MCRSWVVRCAVVLHCRVGVIMGPTGVMFVVLKAKGVVTGVVAERHI